jgi:hypothetical protein
MRKESFYVLPGAKHREGRQGADGSEGGGEGGSGARPRPLRKRGKHQALAVGESERSEGSSSCRIVTDRRLEKDVNAVF